jgi:hypothetical protein
MLEEMAMRTASLLESSAVLGGEGSCVVVEGVLLTADARRCRVR